MYVAIARKLQGIPVEERPWNVTKGMTAGLDNLATGILNDEDIFDEDYPTKEKLAKSTIITLLKDMRERSVDAAKTYEEAVKDINRPAGKYTLATSKNDEEVIELGSVSDKVNLKVRTFVDCLKRETVHRLVPTKVDLEVTVDSDLMTICQKGCVVEAR